MKTLLDEISNEVTAMFQCLNCLNWVYKYEKAPLTCDYCGTEHERLSPTRIEPLIHLAAKKNIKDRLSLEMINEAVKQGKKLSSPLYICPKCFKQYYALPQTLGWPKSVRCDCGGDAVKKIK